MTDSPLFCFSRFRLKIPVAALMIVLSCLACRARAGQGAIHSASTSAPAPARIMLSRADRTALTAMQRQMAGDLQDDVLPFWTRHTVDPDGGFDTIVDRGGKPTSTDRFTVVEARMVWTLSAAQRYGVKSVRYLSLAESAAHWITAHLWDTQGGGGFFLSATKAGKPLNSGKYLYAQEFVLYGLSEYARDTPNASERQWALGWCDKIFQLIQTRYADPKYPGYVEDLDRNWQPLQESLGVGGVSSGKTLNTHMHLMEAFTSLVNARHGTPQEVSYKAALADVTDLLLDKTIAPEGYAKEPFDREWNPVPDGKGRFSVFYGHDVEFAWLLIDAMNALGRDPKTIKPVVLGLIDHALAHGVDRIRGGIANLGPRTGGLTDVHATSYEGARLTKQWWQQAEALTAYSTAFRWTGNRKYLVALEKEWAWIERRQMDHPDRDWFNEVDWATGKPTSYDKGLGGWKVCYHNGRALMRASEQLRLILAGSAQPV